MSFAIIETGGKQYKISEGETLRTEKFNDELKEGDKVTFDKVLLISDGDDVEIGEPYISGATIEADFEKTGKGKKLHVIRFRPKSRYHRKYGHRQPYSEVKIGTIGKEGKKSTPKKAATKKTATKKTTEAHQKTSQKPSDIGKIEPTSKAPKKRTPVKTEKSHSTNQAVDNEMKETESTEGKGVKK